MAIKIDVQKTYEEVEIIDSVYRLELNDESMKKYDKLFLKFRKESLKMSERDYSKMTEKERKAAEKENHTMMFEVTEALLGEGSFEKIYSETGRSLFIMADIIMQLMQVVDKRLSIFKEKEKAYYLGSE